MSNRFMIPVLCLIIMALSVSSTAAQGMGGMGGGMGGMGGRSGRGGRGGEMGSEGQGGQFMVQRFMEKYDQNRDGSVTRDEFKAVRADQFTKLDVDGDNVLTLTEFKTQLPEGKQEHAVALFGRIDADRDGKVTRAEYDADSNRRFDIFDVLVISRLS